MLECGIGVVRAGVVLACDWWGGVVALVGAGSCVCTAQASKLRVEVKTTVYAGTGGGEAQMVFVSRANID